MSSNIANIGTYNLYNNSDGITSVALGTNKMYVGFKDHTFRAWYFDTSSSDFIPLLDSVNLTNKAVIALGVTPDDTTVFSCGIYDAFVKIWDVSSGIYATELGTVSSKNSKPMKCGFTSDSKYLIASRSSSELAVWSLLDLSLVKTLKNSCGDAEAIAVSPNGKYVAAVANSKIVIWDFNSGIKLFTRYLSNLKNSSPVSTLAFADDDCLLFLEYGQSITVWNIAERSYDRLLSFSYCPVEFVVGSINKELLIYGSASGEVIIYDLKSEEEVAVLKGHRARITAIAINANDKMLTTISADGEMKVWEIHSLNEYRILHAIDLLLYDAKLHNSSVSAEQLELMLADFMSPAGDIADYLADKHINI